jgi:hypothetical protein
MMVQGGIAQGFEVGGGDIHLDDMAGGDDGAATAGEDGGDAAGFGGDFLRSAVGQEVLGVDAAVQADARTSPRAPCRTPASHGPVISR